jgi:hypothetical protein
MKFHSATGLEELEKITVSPKNKIILRDDEGFSVMEELLTEIDDTIDLGQRIGLTFHSFLYFYQKVIFEIY